MNKRDREQKTYNKETVKFPKQFAISTLTCDQAFVGARKA